MTRKEKSERLFYFQTGRDLFAEPGVKRLLRMNYGAQLFVLFLKAQVEALSGNGILQPWDDMTPEELISILIECSEDEAVDMVAAAVKSRLIVRDGDCLCFPLTEKYTRSYTKQTVNRRRAKQQSQAEPEPEEAPEPAKKSRKKATAGTTKHQDGLDVRLLRDGVLSTDAPPDMARWERVKFKYTNAEQDKAEQLYLH